MKPVLLIITCLRHLLVKTLFWDAPSNDVRRSKVVYVSGHLTLHTVRLHTGQQICMSLVHDLRPVTCFLSHKYTTYLTLWHLIILKHHRSFPQPGLGTNLWAKKPAFMTLVFLT